MAADRLEIFEMMWLTKKALWYFGLYSSKNMRSNILCKMNLTLILFLWLSFLILMCMEFFEDVSLFLDIVLVFYGITWCTGKLLLFLYISSDFNVIENLLEKSSLNMQNAEQDKLVSTTIRNYQNITKLYSCPFATAILGISAFPFVNKETLIVPIWAPICRNNTVATYFWFAYEAFCMYTAGTVFCGVDFIMLGLMMIIALQYKILRDNLEKSAKRDLRKDYLTQEREIQERLRKCVVHHNAILELTEKVETTFSSIFLYQVLVSVLGICVAAVQIVLIPSVAVKHAPPCMVLLALIFQISIPCWFGQNIKTQSLGVTDSCYASEWYTCSTSTKKMIFVIMEKAKNPATLRAKPFFQLSLETFVMVLRNAYFYFTVVHQVYQQ
uniref:Odorant receptor n=1 Tax=Holotrichia parallela TaxID=93412 RepID=A0AA50A8W3_HOLPA|nr:odorant receptor 41a [Holotrichia parallela]